MKTIVKDIIEVKMYIYNSTKSLTEYLSNQQFSTIYVEDCSPVYIESNVKLAKIEAVDFLLGSASVGNKTIGFFNEMPDISVSRPLRGVCLLVSTKLVKDVVLPTFFCRYAAKISEIFPKALKVSMDTNMPVQIVLSANALNNYTGTPFPLSDHDRVSPYLHANSYSAVREITATEQKLEASYNTVFQNFPLEQMPAEMAFELPDKEFPEYIFPLDIDAQKKLFSSLKSVSTTKEEALFFHNILNKLMRLNITVNADLPPMQNDTITYLCPGCPFAAIYANVNLADHMVFTSVTCPAIYDIYKLYSATFAEYIGITSRKLNTATVFIGNVSDVPVGGSAYLENSSFILLQDIPTKSPFPAISHPSKLKVLKNITMPYSCNNIKKYFTIKIKPKKCKCIKNLGLSCVEGAHCPAFYKGEEYMKISDTLCTGCRSCIPHCTSRALS